MALNQKIQAYLAQNNIAYESGDYMTGQPEGQEDQVLHWDFKLGAQPTQEQLDAAWDNEQAKPAPAPTKEQLMAELAALTAKIQALE